MNFNSSKQSHADLLHFPLSLEHTNLWQVYVFFFQYTALAPRLQTVTNETLWKWGHFDKAKLTLKMLPASWNFDTLITGLDLLMLEIWNL